MAESKNTPASLDVQILCQQFVNAVQAEQERLAVRRKRSQPQGVGGKPTIVK